MNESFARRFARGQSPVGRILETNAALSWWGKGFPTRFEIVGVVRDVRFLGLQKEPEPAFYLSDRQFPLTDLKVVIRTSGDPRSLITAVRRILREASPTQPAGKISTLAELYDRALGQPRVNTRLMVLFGVSAADPAAWAAAPAALLAVALFATWLPARRATRIDPMETLKTE